MKAGWEIKSLGEVIQLEYGKPLPPEDRNPNGMYPAYGANGEKDRTDKFYRDCPSIIVGRKGSAGEITLTEDKFWPLDVTYFVEFDRQRHDLKFLYYLLATLDLPKLAKGVKPGINRNEVYSLPIAVPTRTEQQRIVAILDEAFEGIATAKANAEKNLQSARELFENYHQSVFSGGDEGWVDYRLGEIASFRNGINYTKQSKGRSVPIIGVKNFQNHLWAPLDDLDSVTLDGELSELDTLAEGDTGKTFIAFQLAWKLFQSRWNLTDWKSDAEPTRRPRILFLADRNILADQAYNAFSAFPDDALVRIAPDEIKKKGRVPKNGSIFFTIFQTFMSGPGDSPYFGDYPPDFFDFIVIDECHRGGANDEGSWRAILDYFAPAVQLGLTATPKRTINADTYAYFGEPVYVYSLKDGINDGFLTPFKVQQIATTLDEYVYTSDDQVLDGEIVVGKRYEEKDFNKIIEIKEREAYRVKLLMGMIDQRQKTIVFCATQDHALAVRDLINQMKTSTDPQYCVRVTANDGALGDQALREFQDNEKTIPTILTTSQKLSTGVDARNVRNIVLMRPVNSMIEFKQIIGRGTRLYDGKDYFTIYDFVKAHHLFSDPEWDGEPEEPAAPEPPRSLPPAPPVEPPDRPQPPVPPPPVKIKVKLANGKERTIRNMTATSFWSADGKPMSAVQFLESLFGALPEFFKDEDELRAIWSDPATRKSLLSGLADKGFSAEPLAEMQKLIEAENSDLFDVLAYVAFEAPTATRSERASQAQAVMHQQFNDKQQAFVDFVLAQYVKEGVDELDAEKLSPLLKLKYNALNDALKDLGSPEQIRQVFVGFQRYLYEPHASG